MSDIRYAPLEPAEAALFATLTFPAYRSLLTHPDAPCVAVGALLDGRPIGLALARPPAGDGRAEVLSLFVEVAQRGRGVGTTLLGHLEGVLAAQGAQVASATYVAGKAVTPALERVVAKRGWLMPVPRMMVFKADIAELGNAQWVDRAEFEGEFEIRPWVSLDPALLAALRQEQEASRWIPEDLVPWRHERGCEPETSLALLRDGAIVGWVLNHRLSDDTLRFSAGWVRPALQRRGRVLGLYAEAGRRALALGYAHATWTVPYHHEAKVAFAKRWMVPYTRRVEESRGTAKWLAPGGLLTVDDL